MAIFFLSFNLIWQFHPFSFHFEMQKRQHLQQQATVHKAIS